MHAILRSVPLLVCLIASTSWAQGDANRQIRQIFADYHQRYLQLFPLDATLFGEPGFNHLLPEPPSVQQNARERGFYEEMQDRLQKIDPDSLDASLRISREVLLGELKGRLDRLQYRPERIPCQQYEGLPITFAQLGSGQSNHPFRTAKDYEDWLQRMEAFPGWIDAAIEQFREGMRDRFVLPKELVEKMIGQSTDTTIFGSEGTPSLFEGPLQRFPSELTDSQKKDLEARFRAAIQGKVLPAYRRLADFLKTEYLPAARSTAGLGQLPQGKELYRALVASWTTTSMDPDEIFQIGLSEVDRIEEQMRGVQQQMGHTGSLAEFHQWVRTDPSFTPYQTPQEVLQAYYAIQKKVEPQLDRIFLNKPKTPFEIRRTESFREATASAEYMPGSEDGTRPGIFYLPIPDAKKFNVTSGMESLFLHEALPGHHYQISLQQENKELPKFARFLWIGAYGEGWALYCETLGRELGLYQDPKQYLGALSDEMHRAIRLVVDPGMHWKGWSRQEAIDYMMAHEPIAEDAAIAEIERYMAIPGQALSYKIGQLAIRRMRERFEAELGEKFSLAQFHHEVLKDGCIQLDLLERKLEAWAAEKKAAVP
ncbi:MAG: DUF885 domain-containing protein [Pirellulaceae bacterium]